MGKSCNKCNEIKDLIHFPKDNSKDDGLFGECRDCNKKRCREYRDRNKDKATIYRLKNKDKQQEYNITNKESISAQRKIHYLENKDRILLKSSLYYLENKDKVRNRGVKYRLENKEKLTKYRSKYKGRRNHIRNIKYKTDVLFKLETNCRNRITFFLNLKSIKKRNRTSELLGCTYYELKKHLEDQFTEGMTWNNHGSWHIDHIIPLSSASNEKELLKLFNYKNTQPLWAMDNLIKSNKIT